MTDGSVTRNDGTEHSVEIRTSTFSDVKRTAYTTRTVPRCDKCFAEIWSTDAQLYAVDGIDKYCRDCWHERTGDDLVEMADRDDDTDTEREVGADD